MQGYWKKYSSTSSTESPALHRHACHSALPASGHGLSFAWKEISSQPLPAKMRSSKTNNTSVATSQIPCRQN